MIKMGTKYLLTYAFHPKFHENETEGKAVSPI